MLQLTLDRLTGDLRTWGGAAVPKIVRKWPSAFSVDLRAAVGTVVGQLGESATGSLLVTEDATGTVLVRAGSFTRVGAGAAAYYSFLLDLDAQPVITRFQADAALASIAASMEIRLQPGEGISEVSATVPFVIERAKGRGNEATPVVGSLLAQSGFLRLGSGVDDGAVVFAPAMLGVPVVTLTLLTPAGSPLLTVNPVGSPTSEGFAFALSGDTPNGDYYLAWSAAVVVGTATRQTGVVSIASGTDTKAVVFSSAMSSAPILRGLSLECPAGSPLLTVNPVGSPTTTGFDVRLGADTTNANYRLHYDAEVPA